MCRANHPPYSSTSEWHSLWLATAWCSCNMHRFLLSASPTNRETLAATGPLATNFRCYCYFCDIK
jgi:hypothetical protein